MAASTWNSPIHYHHKNTEVEVSHRHGRSGILVPRKIMPKETVSNADDALQSLALEILYKSFVIGIINFTSLVPVSWYLQTWWSVHDSQSCLEFYCSILIPYQIIYCWIIISLLAMIFWFLPSSKDITQSFSYQGYYQNAISHCCMLTGKFCNLPCCSCGYGCIWEFQCPIFSCKHVVRVLGPQISTFLYKCISVFAMYTVTRCKLHMATNCKSIAPSGRYIEFFLLIICNSEL